MTETNSPLVWTSRSKAVLVGIIAAWFAAAAFIGTAQLLPNKGASLIAPIGVTAFAPVAVFLGFYLVSGRFRTFVLAQNIETLTMLQHWRVIGFAFLPLHFYGVLPALFAFPAGLGDVAIGLAAPLIVLRLRRDPAYATSAGLVRYQYLGLLDFVVAIATAGLTAGSIAALTPDGVTSTAMDVWPLNLFPSFIVPIFIILHLSVLLKVRSLRQQETASFTGGLSAA